MGDLKRLHRTASSHGAVEGTGVTKESKSNKSIKKIDLAQARGGSGYLTCYRVLGE